MHRESGAHMGQGVVGLNVQTVPVLRHCEAMGLAETKFGQMLDLLRQLRTDEWRTKTVCALWDVRALVSHVLGMAERR